MGRRWPARHDGGEPSGGLRRPRGMDDLRNLELRNLERPVAVPLKQTGSRGDAEPASPRGRLVGLDAFRGAVLAVMVLTPVSGQAGSYPLLGHAGWNGFTVADAILPAFLVASGTSLALLLRPPVSGATRLRLVRRTVALLILGVVYNAWGQPWDLSAIRLTGVLQLIAIAGAVAAAAVLAVRRLTTRVWPLLVLAALLPLIHGVALAVAATDCTAELAACSPHLGLDVAVFGAGHLYAGGTASYDPEGLVVSVVAASLVLIGVRWTQQRRGEVGFEQPGHQDRQPKWVFGERLKHRGGEPANCPPRRRCGQRSARVVRGGAADLPDPVAEHA